MGPVWSTITCACKHKYNAWRPAVPSPTQPKDCPRCLDEEMQAASLERKQLQEKRARKDRLNEIQQLAHIPPRFTGKSIGDYRATTEGQRTAQTVCQQYAKHWPDMSAQGRSLVLTGLPGTGKTHLACAIANVIMPGHMASVSFGAVSTILRGIRSTYGGKGSETQAINDLLKPDLLIMDEIGAEGGSDHDTRLLFEIINKRYENLRPMILISNLNVDDLKKYLGHRAMDRFSECGTVLAFDWPSFRDGQQALV